MKRFFVIASILSLGLLPLACVRTFSLSPLSATSTPTYSGRVVSTLAGGGVCCTTNGPGTIASFSGPTGVAVDSSGTVYVADPNNGMIRKITPGGVVSTFFQGYGLSLGVGVDSTGKVYVAASGDDMITWFTPGGVPTTLAGSAGVTGATNGTGSAALFNFPTGVAVDSSFNVYVADPGNQLVRKITPGGAVTTLAGSAGVSGATNATGTAASFNGPFGVAVDASGNVYVADFGNQLIRVITPGGIVSTLAGSAGVSGATNATGTAASFSSPTGVAVDASGNVFVADSGNDLIREITPGGVVSTVAGQAGVTGSTNGPVSIALLDNPYGIAFDSSGYLYVAEYNNGNLIRKISP